MSVLTFVHFRQRTELIVPLKPHSCTPDEIHFAADEGRPTVLFRWISAFDVTDHCIPRNRVQHCSGVSGTALVWFRTYLSSRQYAPFAAGVLCLVPLCFHVALPLSATLWLASLVVRELDSRLDGRRFQAAATNTGMGDRLRAGKPPQYFTKPLGPTQPLTLSGTGNEYQPTCGDDLPLGVKGSYGSFQLWINV